jgi:hypothetical protein
LLRFGLNSDRRKPFKLLSKGKFNNFKMTPAAVADASFLNLLVVFMALIPAAGSSQVALVPSRALSVALARSDARLDDETQRTVRVFEQYRREVQAELAARNEEIRRLRELLVAANARPGELNRVHAAEIAARDARIETEVRNVVAARQEAIAAAQLGDQRVAAERTAGVVAVAAVQQELLLARQETAVARTEAAQREAALIAERNAAVLAATQRGDAQVAAERQTAQEERVRQEGVTQMKLQEAEDTWKMQKFLGEFIRNQHEICASWDSGHPKLLTGPGSKYIPERMRRGDLGHRVPDLLIKLEVMISERFARPVLDNATQEAHTQQLELLDSAIMSASAPYASSSWRASPQAKQLCEEAVLGILRPLIAARKARIRPV